MARACWIAALTGACGLSTPTLEAPRDAGASPTLERIETLKAAVAVRPDDATAHRRLGTTLAHAVLRGDLNQQAWAEYHLERAYRLKPEAKTAPRVLARLLNLRLVTGDWSKVELQAELYRHLTATEVQPDDAFVYACFTRAIEAADAYARGRPIAALREIRELERELEVRLEHHPDDIDTHAMAGNYALTFAGMLPWGRGRRLDTAIEHLEVQQARWDELSPDARGWGIAPNTRGVFRLWLAEALLARGDLEDAMHHYRAVASDVGDSRTAEQLAAVARLRQETAADYAGDRALLPAWPSGATACIACHGEDARLSTASLYLPASR